MTTRIVLLKLIFLLFKNNLIYAQEIGFENEFSSDQDILTQINNAPIDWYSKPLLIQENLIIDSSNLKYEKKIINLESNFELIPTSPLLLEPFVPSALINRNYKNHLILSNDNNDNPDLSIELSLVLQNYQQTNKPSDFHNLSASKTNSSPPINLWNLTDKYLTISPISWHIDYTEPDVNNFPLGMGAAYNFEIINPNYGFFDNLVQDSIASLEFNIFRDSDFGYPAAYVGLSLRKNIFASPIQVGSAIGLLYTTQLQELSGSPVLPFMLPFLQTDFDIPVNLRIVYIPSFADYNSQQVFFTLMIKVN
ncbi:hypothetical protein IQE94_09255 [Synechocystis sp. PCC 7339]|nr:hypothetical protein HTZ78_17020 [Synechocystis sp. PCC 7338]UAJ74424.1 hypothetical protein IQE94_09255 [Synechocystis sp. PCC 7339]